MKFQIKNPYTNATSLPKLLSGKLRLPEVCGSMEAGT